MTQRGAKRTSLTSGHPENRPFVQLVLPNPASNPTASRPISAPRSEGSGGTAGGTLRSNSSQAAVDDQETATLNLPCV